MSFLCNFYLYGLVSFFVLFVFVDSRVVFVLFVFVFVGGSCGFCIICICKGLVSFLCYLYL